MGQNPKAPLARASTVTAGTSISQLMRSASMSRNSSSSRRRTSIGGSSVTSASLYAPSSSSPLSSSSSATTTSMQSASTSRSSRRKTSVSTTTIGSTLVPPSVASKTSSATSMSLYAPSSSSPLSSSSSTATAMTALTRSTSKRSRASSFLSTATSRLLYGRPPPGHATLRPNQIATLTRALSFPSDTPMMASIVAAMGPPLSRPQFSAAVGGFCDAHFWLEREYVAELTAVVAVEVGPQLDRLRIAPAGLVSKKTKRLLETLKPYRDLFAGVAEKRSTASSKPVCSACTLSFFMQDTVAFKALSICVKGRKHRNQPWPSSMAWLEPCPGKGVDWEAKWKTEGKFVSRDRSRVQRWRRANRSREPVPEEHLQVSGHGPGEGCDFCDSLRMEQADEAELDAVIAEKDEEEGAAGSLDAEGDDDITVVVDDDDDETETLRNSSPSESVRAEEEISIIEDYLDPSDSASVRAMEEESIIDEYLDSSDSETVRAKEGEECTIQDSLKTTDSVYDSLANEGLDHWEMEETQRRVEDDIMGFLSGVGNKGEPEPNERTRKASDWARSYRDLVGREAALRTTLQFQRFSQSDMGQGAEEVWI